MSMGEKSTIAVHNPVSSGEMAICESILNLCSSPVGNIEKIAFRQTGCPVLKMILINTIFSKQQNQ